MRIESLIADWKSDDYTPGHRVIDEILNGDPWPAEYLAQMLTHEHRNVRLLMARSLATNAAPGTLQVDALVASLSDEDWFVRREAAKALARVGKSAQPGVPALIRAARNDKEWRVREAACHCLGKTTVQRENVVEVLIGAIRNQETGVRIAAIKALGELGHKDQMVVDSLADLLDHKLETVRNAAAMSLGTFEADARAAVPRLEKYLTEEISLLRGYAILDHHAIYSYVASLSDENANDLGWELDGTVPELILRLRDANNGRVRCASAVAMSRINSEAWNAATKRIEEEGRSEVSEAAEVLRHGKWQQRWWSVVTNNQTDRDLWRTHRASLASANPTCTKFIDRVGGLFDVVEALEIVRPASPEEVAAFDTATTLLEETARALGSDMYVEAAREALHASLRLAHEEVAVRARGFYSCFDPLVPQRSELRDVTFSAAHLVSEAARLVWNCVARKCPI